uniref:Uncharacterized protein n=1 Tax=Meleagris gallopavo TaxID=9103 RepID=A0A803Y9W2_MELGA
GRCSPEQGWLLLLWTTPNLRVPVPGVLSSLPLCHCPTWGHLHTSLAGCDGDADAFLPRCPMGTSGTRHMVTQEDAAMCHVLTINLLSKAVLGWCPILPISSHVAISCSKAAGREPTL